MLRRHQEEQDYEGEESEREEVEIESQSEDEQETGYNLIIKVSSDFNQKTCQYKRLVQMS